MKFDYCPDPAHWGDKVADELLKRGHKHDSSAPDVVFIRMLTVEPHRYRGLSYFQRWNQRGIPSVPSRQDILLYDEKVDQWKALSKFMPKSILLSSYEDCQKFALCPDFGWPVLSKSSRGAQSRNVRLHETPVTFLAEASKIFSQAGLQLVKASHQRNYMFIQQFIPNNTGDLRIIRLGQYWMLLERNNRPDIPFASGSGDNAPVKTLTDRHYAALCVAEGVVTQLNSKMCAMDFVFDDGVPLLLETSCSWVDTGYTDCILFEGENGRYVPATKYKTGADWVSILADEMEEAACL